MPLASLLTSPLLAACLPAGALLVRYGDTGRCWTTADWLLCGTALSVVFGWFCRGAAQSALQPLLMLLVLFLAWVILRFSRVYLSGEASQRRYIHLLAATISASCAVIAAPRLDVLLVAWVVVSLTMNGLLQHYPDRRPAQLAAHKKFLVSRLGEGFLAAACFCIDCSVGTLSIPDICKAASLPGPLPHALQAAAVLLVLAVLLKTAQMPLHGWLMQVMEAPTPVSALLHAGVVNLGGIVLLRLSPLLDKSFPAQALLVGCGGLTMLLAGVVTMTRVSIKVRLAWSTCAQMGFLMAECGLGLYQLALLHLIGHSLYKAHAFLTSGSAVQLFKAEHAFLKCPRRASIGLMGDLAAALLSVAATCAAYFLLFPEVRATDLAAVMTVGIALAPALRFTHGSAGRLPAVLTRFAPLLGLYFAWHLLLRGVLRDGADRSMWLTLLFGALLLSLYLLQSLIHNRMTSPWMDTLRRWAFHGFYLDESVTRFALAVWPARYSGHEPQQSAVAAYIKELA